PRAGTLAAAGPARAARAEPLRADARDTGLRAPGDRAARPPPPASRAAPLRDHRALGGRQHGSRATPDGGSASPRMHVRARRLRRRLLVLALPQAAAGGFPQAR